MTLHTVCHGPKFTGTARQSSGDLDVLAAPILVLWCEDAAFQVCAQSVDPDHTTVGTTLTIDHVKGSPGGAEITVHCAEPSNNGRPFLVCHVIVKGAQGEQIATDEVHRGRRRPRPLHEQVFLARGAGVIRWSRTCQGSFRLSCAPYGHRLTNSVRP